MLRSIALSLVLASVGGAGLARAQEFNRQAFPVGDIAAGLGGAYSGWARDASGTFYNPAGLPFGRGGSVSVGLSLPIIDEYTVRGAMAGNTTLDYRDAFGVPFYAGGVLQAGRDGAGRHSVGLATFQPSRTNRRFTFADASGAPEFLRVHRSDQMRWYGLSYAYRPTEWLAVGASVFVAVRNFWHREEQIRADGILRARGSEVKLSSELVLFRIGALARALDELSFGLVFQPPAIVASGRGRIAAISGEPGATLSIAEQVSAASPLPWQIRLGAAWTPEPPVLFTLDVILEGALGSQTRPIQRFAVASPPGLLGNYLETEYWTDYVVDVAVGGHGVIEDTVPVSVGFFTSFASAPPITDTSTYRPDRIDIFGATLAVGFVNDDIDLSIGLVGSLGVGHGLIARPFAGLGGPTYDLVGVESRSIYIFLTGAGGAARAIGRGVVEEIIRAAGEDEEVDTGEQREEEEIGPEER